MDVLSDTLAVPDGRLYYELRGEGPLIALIGAPMDADAFAPLADLLARDHQVLTADPRGVKRSVLHDPGRESSPESRADDLAALIAHVGTGPAAVLGSSGGAVTALAFAQRHPSSATTVVAHEPPLTELLPDREEQRRQTAALVAAAASGDRLGAWRLFFAQANIGMPEEMLVEWFGGEPEPQAARDERFWFAHELPATVGWTPDAARLREGGARIVPGIGAESTGQLCERTATALGELLRAEPVRFPGDHTGFVDHPEEFAARLRDVLSAG